MKNTHANSSQSGRLILFLTVFVWGVSFNVATYSAQYNTKKALIEVNDAKANKNPVKSVRADSWKAVDVKNKIKPRPGQDIAVVCEGNFPAGIIASDLFRPNGDFNRDFKVTPSTTVLDICNQQEDIMRVRNPRLFK